MKKINISKITLLIVITLLCIFAYNSFKGAREKEALKKIIARLEADSRIANVIVSDVRTDPASGKTLTTIKFLEYDVQGRPLTPRYFTFSGNIIQFQSLVVRFRDFYVERGDPVRGKSAYLFLKVFFLDGPNTQVFDITPIHEIPAGYQVDDRQPTLIKVQKDFWNRFWEYALNSKEAKKVGIKSAQIEAPGTKFVPGMLYTIKIEHNGGIRIDVQSLPEILKGERVAF
jgi:hypothetical protein